MHLATLLLHLRLNGCSNPRLRRKTVDAIFEKLRSHFNVSLVDLGPSEPVDELRLGIAAVGRSRREVREVMEHIAEAIDAHPLAESLAPPQFQER